jgi:hypothetical protein
MARIDCARPAPEFFWFNTAKLHFGVASVREIYETEDKTAATDIVLAGAYGQDYRRFTDGAPPAGAFDRGVRYRHVLSGRTRSHGDTPITAIFHPSSVPIEHRRSLACEAGN